jgi:futalosine hydrolase
LRILVVAATELEVAPLVTELRPVDDRGPLKKYAFGSKEVDVLTPGVGMVATAAWCSRALAMTRYDMALNLGVCGTFDPSLPLGGAVHVIADRLAELGAEDGEEFLTVQQLALLGDDEPPFRGGRLLNETPPSGATLAALPAVTAITVSTAHGDERTIARVVDRFHPQVESMEGAAFMYACLIHGVVFAQVRAVSNVVERRNRQAWRMADAIDRLGVTALRVLAEA